MSDFTKEELVLGERMFDSQPDSPWTAFCELRELFGSMSLERQQALHDVVAKRRAGAQRAEPIQRGFEYEVKLAVSIPTVWAQLLKDAAKHHYDHRCNEAGHHGVVNGLYNTSQSGPLQSTLAVTWRDLDLVTKVAEQLEYHTTDHVMIREIRTWLRATKDTIEKQHRSCLELPGSRDYDNEEPA